MSATKHTEGPWEVDGFAIVGSGQTICLMGEIDGFERGYTPCKNDGPNGRLIAAAPDLADELARMIKAYVSLLETGRDRIVSAGGQCDPVDVMEAGSPNLRSAKAALAKARS
ncbi:hypothetical protein [Aurantimonas sp. NFXS3]|uniref:hypothetical protein n=1 Tax=Aurantimonas sp. NFXS3 TaxID=2818434 RepID=UPI003B8E32B6